MQIGYEGGGTFNYIKFGQSTRTSLRMAFLMGSCRRFLNNKVQLYGVD